MAVDNQLLLMLKSSGLGEGEPDLGEKLMKAFLNMLLETERTPAKIICMNSGVFLTTKGSQVLGALAEFQKRGAEILSCGTCLDYYGKKEQLEIGEPTNMRDTVKAMLEHEKILSP